MPRGKQNQKGYYSPNRSGGNGGLLQRLFSNDEGAVKSNEDYDPSFDASKEGAYGFTSKGFDPNIDYQSPLADNRSLWQKFGGVPNYARQINANVLQANTLRPGALSQYGQEQNLLTQALKQRGIDTSNQTYADQQRLASDRGRNLVNLAASTQNFTGLIPGMPTSNADVAAQYDLAHGANTQFGALAAPSLTESTINASKAKNQQAINERQRLMGASGLQYNIGSAQALADSLSPGLGTEGLKLGNERMALANTGQKLGNESQDIRNQSARLGLFGDEYLAAFNRAMIPFAADAGKAQGQFNIVNPGQRSLAQELGNLGLSLENKGRVFSNKSLANQADVTEFEAEKARQTLPYVPTIIQNSLTAQDLQNWQNRFSQGGFYLNPNGTIQSYNRPKVEQFKSEKPLIINGKDSGLTTKTEDTKEVPASIGQVITPEAIAQAKAELEALKASQAVVPDEEIIKRLLKLKLKK